MGDKDGEVGKTALVGLVDRHGIRRSSGLKSNGEENDFFFGVGFRNGQGIERGIHNPYIMAAGFYS